MSGNALRVAMSGHGGVCVLKLSGEIRPRDHLLVRDALLRAVLMLPLAVVVCFGWSPERVVVAVDDDRPVPCRPADLRRAVAPGPVVRCGWSGTFSGGTVIWAVLAVGHDPVGARSRHDTVGTP
ncbi:hypothetical protein GCM10010492_59480 [Saccharothrix mutabilis subsp. mutabilis]|uniref:Uncharacterized protein n=1 Tax=Saccharothrix mutabilis subsp. mutabilis TaxID=66855 RepID=A0ABN0UI03_9PSEU